MLNQIASSKHSNPIAKQIGARHYLKILTSNQYYHNIFITAKKLFLFFIWIFMPVISTFFPLVLQILTKPKYSFSVDKCQFPFMMTLFSYQLYIAFLKKAFFCNKLTEIEEMICFVMPCKFCFFTFLLKNRTDTIFF